MEYWEFLIQRAGDRGWRTIETGNLQLMEGKYRIVANSDLLDTQIQTRVTYQTSDPQPQRRSQARNQTTNRRGLLAVIPFTSLKSGIWQFVCSGTTEAQASWQRILKLRVLPAIAKSDPEPAVARAEDRFELPTPTQPVVPISMVGIQENWVDGLDRLLEQLERESLQPQPPKISGLMPGAIQLTTIFDSPGQLINLDRSTFSGLIPGHPLMISGACNLQKLSANLIQSVKIEKLSICLRHPHTSEIIVAIEQSIPPQFNTFTFNGKVDLPTQPQISLLIGEVNLYDKHNIQLGSCGFTVTLSLNSLNESELTLFQLSEQRQDNTGELLDRFTEELQLETTIMGARRQIQHGTPSSIRSLNQPQSSPNFPATQFTHPDIVPVNASPQHLPAHTLDITGDLEIDFALSSFGDSHQSRNYENLEIVVED
ncbi:MAG: hypothetical protein LH474_11295 [Chamaesiphon sp.]|nr:hypothetical protein [Chamaesiphon sp.]